MGIIFYHWEIRKFRIGATYQWENLNTEITAEARLELETNLRALISCDFKITDQQAGICPSVRDRRPSLGFHPQHKMLAVFNGLGTKGAMQGPFLCETNVATVDKWNRTSC